MKIVWNNNINKTPFANVKEGDTFMFGTSMYIKAIPIGVQNINAINIENGNSIHFFDDEYVTPVVGKFVMD